MPVGAVVVVQSPDVAVRRGAQTKINKKKSRIVAERQRGILLNESQIREGAREPYSGRMTGGAF